MRSGRIISPTLAFATSLLMVTTCLGIDAKRPPAFGGGVLIGQHGGRVPNPPQL